MTKEKNQQPQVSLETSSEQSQLEKPAETAEELSINVKSETLSQAIENNAEDRLKALGRLMMVSLTWSLAGLSKRE
ncbi:hypothetical protein [Microcoleus asticus]|uniref:Uncharacterized protein n=1 Tax=Microcoleus asticus IPMA8 TaxID=2563858 RepID=A0ABX2D173_9CYAN|nr:hypothetical protein [Microcoleus asticus]NQE36402.1 hypothetical protein [Microcoleus asticus IPMA8]